MIIVDTHVLVWSALDDKRLGRSARRHVQTALRASELNVSAISYWEIAMLAATGKLRLDSPPEAFRAESLARGINEVPVDGKIAILATRLTGMHADPADRIIVASALEHNALLVTADAKILGLKSGPTRLDAQT
ncbi:MAG: type II toxin-antitoxin system VapC family toxin [Polyangiaceae bacterium]|nr:type II toxin-antitoxin system VapC family toxin [Polyangiaceae bacterium]